MNSMEKNPKSEIIFQLPAGFRFHPSDEELIVHYLGKKANKFPLPASIVAEVELYKFNPWDLPKKCSFGDEEWYFFTPRDRKYPNGMRPNRMAGSGYWKATGIDKPIVASCGSKVIGVKKALVFYTGKPPKGNKTDWTMHEYRLPEPAAPAADSSWTTSTTKQNSMRLDEWVLCRVRQKTGMNFGNFGEERNGLNNNNNNNKTVQKPQKTANYSTFEIVKDYDDLYYKEYGPMLPFLFNDNSSSQDLASTDQTTISFEGKNVKDSSSSSVCEDNFNIGIGIVNGKRKMFEDQDNIISHKKLAYQKEMENDDDELLPITPSSNNNNIDQLCSSMMYQELYTLAFT
ncbi:hypothetical protein M9H77_24632 [Catharanthus roseus]|uniref:Uncharacterized protein n=1 Tax=Catharanthus roseus TaxID=4058 RepID=A0ACC0AYV0_CATRO|nr:hypothetical protein M9H77_24632 [Catharanthus roseus]